MPSSDNVLITGANRGIGLEFVRQYLARGSRVFATARDPSKARELQTLVKEHGNERLVLVPLDVNDADSIAAARDLIRQHTDILDLLINNAGIYGAKVGPDGQPTEGVGKFSFEDALTVMRTNAVAPLLIAQALLDLLRKSKHPKIVNITSGYGSVSSNTGGFPYYYSASKAALNMFMRSLAADDAAKGIVTILMSPGWVKTDMGTDAAPLEPEESVSGMIKVIDGLTAKDNSRFVDYAGKEQPW